MNAQEIIEIKLMFEQAVQGFDKMEQKLDAMEKKLDSIGTKLDKSQKQTEQNFNSMQKVGSALSNFGSQLDSLGNKLLYFGASWSAGISVPLQRFGQDAVQIFLKVDKEWTRMAKALGEDVDMLRGKYGEFAKTLSEKFGQSQSNVIESMTEISKAGFDTTEQIEKLAEASAKAAINFDTDLSEATELTIQLMRQWGWTLEDVEVGLSMVNEIADATATSEINLAKAFTIAGPAARAMGIEAEVAAAHIAAIEGKGFTAQKAGYALNTLYQRMTERLDDLSQALSIMGVKMSSAELKQLSGQQRITLLAQAYDKFRDKLGLSTTAVIDFAHQADEVDGNLKSTNSKMNDLANAVSQLSGKHHFPKLLALLEDMSAGMDGSTTTISEYEKALKAVGLSNEELVDILNNKTNKSLQSASQKWASMMEKINNAKESIGGLILDAINPLVDKFLSLLDKFNKLDDGIKNFLVRVGLIATAIGPLAIFVASLVKGLAFLANTFGAVSSAVGGATASIGALPFAAIVVAIAGAVYWLKQLGESIKTNLFDRLKPETLEKIAGVLGKIKEGFMEGFNAIDTSKIEKGWMDIVAANLRKIADLLNNTDWEKVGEIAKKIGQAIGVLAKIIVTIIKVIGFFGLLGTWFATLTPTIIGTLVRWGKAFWDFVSGVVSAIVSFYVNTYAKIFSWIANVGKAIFGFLSGVVNGFKQWAVSVITTVVQFGTNIYNTVSSALQPVTNLFSEIFRLIGSIVELGMLAVLYVVSVVWNGIKMVITNTWNAIWGFLEPIVTKVKDFIITTFDTVKNTLSLIWTSISGAISTVWNYIANTIIIPALNWIKTNIINRFTEAKDAAISKFTELRDSAVKRFEEFKSSVSTKLTEAKSVVTTKISSAVQPILDVVSKAKTWGTDMIQNFINGITNKISSLNNKIEEVAETIRKKIHFTVPDEGPLADADEYMPDFIDLMVAGLDKNASKLYSKFNEIASGIKTVLNPDLSFANLGDPTLGFTPTLQNENGFINDVKSNLAVPIEAASPRQNVVQIHKHFEVKPGVMIASDAEQREFVRHIQKLEEIENIRTTPQ